MIWTGTAPAQRFRNSIRNLKVEGFDVGIKTVGPTASVTFEHVTLEDQNEYGWYNTTSQMIFARSLKSQNDVPAIYNEGGENEDSHFVLFRSALEGGDGGSAIVNEDSMFLRHVASVRVLQRVRIGEE